MNDDITRVLNEIRVEQQRAIANGMNEHDHEHTPEVWTTKLAAALGGFAQFRNQRIASRIQLLELGSLVVAAIVAYDIKEQSLSLPEDTIIRTGSTVRIDAEMDR